MANNYNKKVSLIVNEAVEGIGHELACKSATTHSICVQ